MACYCLDTIGMTMGCKLVIVTEKGTMKRKPRLVETEADQSRHLMKARTSDLYAEASS